jgi:hypothetical protein
LFENLSWADLGATPGETETSAMGGTAASRGGGTISLGVSWGLGRPLNGDFGGENARGSGPPSIVNSRWSPGPGSLLRPNCPASWSPGDPADLLPCDLDDSYLSRPWLALCSSFCSSLREPPRLIVVLYDRDLCQGEVAAVAV